MERRGRGGGRDRWKGESEWRGFGRDCEREGRMGGRERVRVRGGSDGGRRGKGGRGLGEMD